MCCLPHGVIRSSQTYLVASHQPTPRRWNLVTRTPLPSWFKLTLVVFVLVFALRYVAAIDTGVSHGVAIRTYVFWALVCAPVAYLADMVLQSVMRYRIVQTAVARVKGSQNR